MPNTLFGLGCFPSVTGCTYLPTPDTSCGELAGTLFTSRVSTAGGLLSLTPRHKGRHEAALAPTSGVSDVRLRFYWAQPRVCCGWESRVAMEPH